MAEFSIIDTYFNRKSPHSVDLGVGDDSALLTLLPQQQSQFPLCAKHPEVSGFQDAIDSKPYADSPRPEAHLRV